MNASMLPVADSRMKNEYLQLVSDIESAIREIMSSERLIASVQCRHGCCSCCIPFSVCCFEASLLAEALCSEPASQVGNSGFCSLLVDEGCSVYNARPIICRTQGLPLAYLDEAAGAIEVSACKLNFPDDFQFEHGDLLYMDPFNSRLMALNEQYCRANSLNPQRRMDIAEIYQEISASGTARSNE